MWRAKEVKYFRVIMESPLMSPVEKIAEKAVRALWVCIQMVVDI